MSDQLCFHWMLFFTVYIRCSRGLYSAHFCSGVFSLEDETSWLAGSVVKEQKCYLQVLFIDFVVRRSALETDNWFDFFFLSPSGR